MGGKKKKKKKKRGGSCIWKDGRREEDANLKATPSQISCRPREKRKGSNLVLGENRGTESGESHLSDRVEGGRGHLLYYSGKER